MDGSTDQQLLRDYAEKKSEAAFAELAQRYVDLVYSAALRMAVDSHAAEDVTQEVFLALAKSAPQLASHPVLVGWLHQTTRNLAANSIRASARRTAREQEAATMNEILTSQREAGWEQIAPQLDDALHELSKEDRDALLLRYFQRKSAQEMAATLGVSSEAAQKRVSRAVERLRELFAKRGIAVGTGGLAVVLSTNAVNAAPAGLTASVSSAAAQAAIASTTTKIIAMTTLHKALVTVAITIAVGTGIYEARQAAHWREEFDKLQRQQSADLQKLQKETDAATKQAAALRSELANLRSNDTELLRLRAKLTQLNRDGAGRNSSTNSSASAVALLKAKLEQMPKYGIPEIKFAREIDWQIAVENQDLNTDHGVRTALSLLRQSAIDKFLNQMMKDAMKKYLAANNNIAPPDLFALKSYFDTPVTDQMLSHYQLLQTGPVDDKADLVKLTYHADEDYDSNHGMSISGAWGGAFDHVHEAVSDAFVRYMADNAGRMPTDASQLQDYLKVTGQSGAWTFTKAPFDPATVQSYINDINAHPPPPGFETISPAIKAFSSANDGKQPNSVTDLLPYITSQDQINAFKQLDPDVAAIGPALDAYAAANNGQIPRSATDITPYLNTPELQKAFRKLSNTNRN